MEYLINLIIIFLCLVLFFVYKKTRSYVSVGGVIMLSIFLFVAVLKFTFVKDPRMLGFRTDNIPITLLPIVIFVAMGVIIFSSMHFKEKKFKVFGWLFSLTTLYLAFGMIQQIFFQVLFTHTLSQVIENKTLVIVFSAIFFSSFHWDWNMERVRFGFLTLFAGVVWSTLFLASPNIYILSISHAILASVYYFVVYPDNIFKRRLSIDQARGLLHHIYH